MEICTEKEYNKTDKEVLKGTCFKTLDGPKRLGMTRD